MVQKIPPKYIRIEKRSGDVIIAPRLVEFLYPCTIFIAYCFEDGVYDGIICYVAQDAIGNIPTNHVYFREYEIYAQTSEQLLSFIISTWPDMMLPTIM
jgi:hypothetical protein